MPGTLKSFIKCIIRSKNTDSPSTQRKQRAIAETIIAATRPRSYISPILLGLAVYVYRHFGSRQLIDVVLDFQQAIQKYNGMNLWLL